jgi:two-component system LytT family sensor kinase
MKSLNRTFFFWLLQVFGWTTYGALVFFATYNKKGFNLSLVFFINLSVSLLMGVYLSHLMRRYIVNSDLLRIRSSNEFFRIIALVLVVSLLHTVMTKLIGLTFFGSFLNISLVSILMNWASFILIFGFWLTIYYGIHLFEEIQRQELDNIILKASQSELELQNLRSQLNPHFLFNALNSITALVEVDPKKSKEAVNLLSNLLRFSLSNSFDRLITIDTELQMVDSYLSLEKIRFEERLRIKKDINESVKPFKIPAFTIQTLVENAIKHGISKLIEGGEIIINIRKAEQNIIIQISNSGILGKEKDLGIGLSNLCKRLEIEYDKKYKFSMLSDDLVHVEIQIPANR